MITKKGQQILNELKSEQTMELEDKKWWFIFREVGSIPRDILRILNVMVNGIFGSFILVLMLFLLTMDEQVITWLLSHTPQEIVEAKNELFRIGFLVASAGLVIYFYRCWIRRVSEKQNYKAMHDAFYDEQKLQIELIEEVLHRHKLIDRKEQ